MRPAVISVLVSRYTSISAFTLLHESPTVPTHQASIITACPGSELNSSRFPQWSLSWPSVSASEGGSSQAKTGYPPLLLETISPPMCDATVYCTALIQYQLHYQLLKPHPNRSFINHQLQPRLQLHTSMQRQKHTCKAERWAGMRRMIDRYKALWQHTPCLKDLAECDQTFIARLLRETHKFHFRYPGLSSHIGFSFVYKF